MRWPALISSPWHWGILLLLIAAIPLRTHALERSLWLDEAWVANSLLEPDLASMMYYEAWLQTTPPVFLLVSRLVLEVLPVTNATFRLLPCLFGLLGVLGMALLARRFVPPPAVFLIVLLFVFAPGHVIYSQMLKQYTSDVFVSILLMGLGLAFLRQRSVGLLAAALAVFVALAGLSYNAVLFMPAFLYGTLFLPPDAGRRMPTWQPRLPCALAVLAAVAATATVNYVVFIEPNLQEAIRGSGRTEGGGEGGGALASLAFIQDKFLNVAGLFEHLFFNVGAPWGGMALWALIGVAGLLAFFGLIHLLLRGSRGRPRNFDKAVVLAFPIAGASFLDVVGFYPLRESRLNLFLFPTVLILFGVGLQAFLLRCRLIARRWGSVRGSLRASRAHASVVLGLTAILALRITVVSSAPFFTWRESIDEDTQAAVAYLASAAGAGDVIYVGATMLEPVKLYTRFTPIDGPRIVQGRVGWPCCPRNVKLDRPPRPNQTLPVELERIFADRFTGTLWMLHTDRPRWEPVGVNYPQLFDQRLRSKGCQRVHAPEFAGIRLTRYRCPTDTAGGDALEIVAPRGPPGTPSVAPTTARR